VAIHTSSAREIDALITNLASDRTADREAAVARLTVIGSRAVERLLWLLRQPEHGAASRVAALRALEAFGDRRALEPALRATTDIDADVATAAIAVVGTFVRGPHSAAAVDGLTAISLDHSASELTRLQAIDVLAGLDARTIRPLWKALAADPHPRVRERVRDPDRSRTDAVAGQADEAAAERLAMIAEGGLPDDPEVVRCLLASGGTVAKLSSLHRVIEWIRDRETTEAPARRAEWTRARGCAHVALAKRSSLLGVYDLREALEGASGTLPVEFLTALALIGDASCLEAMATAHGRATDRWWREHLADTFHAIVARKRLTRRHAVLKKIQRRSPGLVSST
jgi:HEAT repeat protein